jgi:flagellar hook-length control protein FliK
MNAPNASPANLLSSAPQAVHGRGAPGRSGDVSTAAEPEKAGQAVDFASLLKNQLPADGKFEALQAVKSALDAPATEDSASPGAVAGADIAALLAQITQPLTATAIPLAPVTVAASAMTLTFDRNAGGTGGTNENPDARTPVRGALEALPTATLAARDDANAGNAGAFAGGGDSPEDAGGQKPAFRLPETSPLAAAHALSQSNTVAGPAMAATTASHANLVAQQPIHSPQWSSEVGHGLVWMARNDVQTAQLSINPPQLGPIEITLSLGKDQASAHFSSPYADVREILQQALPRLREILEGAGVQLGQADVSAQQQQAWQQPGRNDRRAETTEFGLEHATLRGPDAVNEASPARARRGLGLVDTFV